MLTIVLQDPLVPVTERTLTALRIITYGSITSNSLVMFLIICNNLSFSGKEKQCF